MRQIAIKGPVLLLMGPLGTFFARFANDLQRQGVPVTKLMFPLHEFGFEASHCLPYRGSMEAFPAFLQRLLVERGIRHVFMYGDFIDPHRLALEVIEGLNTRTDRDFDIDAWVFELGYIRPNFITLERERVNARSSLNKPASFYQALPPVSSIRADYEKPGSRWRKAWKLPTFIQHSLTDYPIIRGPHKLQPKPSYLLYQVRGLLRKYLYRFSEKKVHHQLENGRPYILVPLQVSSDSQVSLGSQYWGMEPFIEELIASFADHHVAGDRLVFKHHPRDRGYNHYGKFIQATARRHGVAHQVLYFHDGALGPILKHAKAVVTINSTVGLQAIYHGIPTKVMGKSYYNLPGLTDQQDLADFWKNPEPSNRGLFYKFYDHLLNTTQLQGNFDSHFDFRTHFAVDHTFSIHAIAQRPSTGEMGRRLLTLGQCFGLYYLQLGALLLGQRTWAKRQLVRSAQLGLKALGVNVLMERRASPLPHRQIHIANHEHPLDVLLVQGYFRDCSLTTAARHLKWILPFLEQSAANYGHTNLDHLNPTSRRHGFHKMLKMLQQRGRIFLFPSGSLVTPITQRVSPSLYVLSRRTGAAIVPWFCSYRGFPATEKQFNYRPLALILHRLSGPQATILCKEGHPIDSRAFKDREALSNHIIDLYRDFEQSQPKVKSLTS